MRRLFTPDEKDPEEIVYIVYHSGIPHELISVCDNLTMSHYDFMKMEGDRNHIGWRLSGAGGVITDINYPKYVNGCKGVTFWLKEGLLLKGNPENCHQINKPKRIKAWSRSSINPFNVATELDFYEYCDICNQNHHDWCKEHQVYLEEDESPDNDSGVYYLDGRRVG